MIHLCFSGVGNFNGEKHCRDVIRLEQDIVTPLAGSGSLHVYHTNKWWSQMKTAGSAIYANRHYLKLYQTAAPELLTLNDNKGPSILGDVYIHPSASVHPTATVSK